MPLLEDMLFHVGVRWSIDAFGGKMAIIVKQLYDDIMFDVIIPPRLLLRHPCSAASPAASRERAL